jgi:hypothetical protein
LYFGGGRNGPNTASQGIDSAPLPTDGNLQLRSAITNGGPGAISGYCMFPYKATFAEIGTVHLSSSSSSSQHSFNEHH